MKLNPGQSINKTWISKIYAEVFLEMLRNVSKKFINRLFLLSPKNVDQLIPKWSRIVTHLK